MICTKDREHFFGEIENGKMKSSPAGAIAHVLWHEIKYHAKNIELGEFVVMPNHVHGILILNGNDGITNGDGDGREVAELESTDVTCNVPANLPTNRIKENNPRYTKKRIDDCRDILENNKFDSGYIESRAKKTKSTIWAFKRLVEAGNYSL